MATRAQQFEILAAGVIYDGSTISTPYVKFLAAGTSTAKDAYADIDKSVAITKKALDTQGRATVYGDGIYKLRFYSGDPDAGGVFKFELDNYKVTASAGDTRTVTSASVTGTVDDSLVVADTTSNNIAYYLPDAALMAGKLLQVAKLVAGNTLTVYPKSGLGQLVNGAASIAYTAAYSTGVFQSDGSNWYVFQTVGDATTLGGNPPSSFYKLIEEITLAAPGAITFSGLTGNETKGYILEVEMIGGSSGSALILNFNGDVTTANYASTGVSPNEGIPLLQPASGDVGVATIRIYPRTGLWRMIHVAGSYVQPATTLNHISFAAAWENTSADITYITLTKLAAAGQHAAIGTRARLWAVGG